MSHAPGANDNQQWKQFTRLKADKRHRAGQPFRAGQRIRAGRRTKRDQHREKDRHSAVRTVSLHQIHWLTTDSPDPMLTIKTNEKTTRTTKRATRMPTPGCKNRLTRRISHWPATSHEPSDGATSDVARTRTISMNTCRQTRRARLKRHPRPQPLRIKAKAMITTLSTMQVRSARRNPSNAKSVKVVVICIVRKRRTRKIQLSTHRVSARTIGGRNSATSTNTRWPSFWGWWCSCSWERVPIWSSMCPSHLLGLNKPCGGPGGSPS